MPYVQSVLLIPLLVDFLSTLRLFSIYPKTSRICDTACSEFANAHKFLTTPKALRKHLDWDFDHWKEFIDNVSRLKMKNIAAVKPLLGQKMLPGYITPSSIEVFLLMWTYSIYKRANDKVKGGGHLFAKGTLVAEKLPDGAATFSNLKFKHEGSDTLVPVSGIDEFIIMDEPCSGNSCGFINSITTIASFLFVPVNKKLFNTDGMKPKRDLLGDIINFTRANGTKLKLMCYGEEDRIQVTKKSPTTKKKTKAKHADDVTSPDETRKTRSATSNKSKSPPAPVDSTKETTSQTEPQSAKATTKTTKISKAKHAESVVPFLQFGTLLKNSTTDTNLMDSFLQLVATSTNVTFTTFEDFKVYVSNLNLPANKDQQSDKTNDAVYTQDEILDTEPGEDFTEPVLTREEVMDEFVYNYEDEIEILNNEDVAGSDIATSFGFDLSEIQLQAHEQVLKQAVCVKTRHNRALWRQLNDDDAKKPSVEIATLIDKVKYINPSS